MLLTISMMFFYLQERQKLEPKPKKPSKKADSLEKTKTSEKSTVHERYPLNPDYLNQIVVLGKIPLDLNLHRFRIPKLFNTTNKFVTRNRVIQIQKCIFLRLVVLFEMIPLIGTASTLKSTIQRTLVKQCYHYQRMTAFANTRACR